MTKEQFKEFVKKNPKLIKYVKNGEMSWQKFYEMYDLYGEDNDIWKEYLKEEDIKAATAGAATVGIADFLTWLKTVNLDSIQEGIENIQRVLGVVQDLSNKNDTPEKETYKPRPLYKHFED